MADYDSGPVARLISLHVDVQLSQYDLDGDRYTIGRLPGVCQIVVARPTVSRIHARLERKGSHFELIDLSRNQTYINRSLLTGVHVLADRDLIGLASPEPLLRFVDSDPTVVTSSRLRFERELVAFTWDNQPIELTPSQSRLLQHLFAHRGEACSRESCARAIWGDDYLPGMDADNLDKVISGLRGRLRQISPDADSIQLRRSVGYVLQL